MCIDSMVSTSLVLRQEIYFTSLLTYLMCIYHSKMSTHIYFYIGSPGGQHGFIDDFD